MFKRSSKSSTTLQTLSVESIAEIAAHLSYPDLMNLQLVSKDLKKLIDDEKVWYRFVTAEFGTIPVKPSSWKKYFLTEAVKFINDKIEFLAAPFTKVSIDKKTLSGVDGHVQSFVLPFLKLQTPFRYYWEITATKFHESYLVAIGISGTTSANNNVVGCSDDYSFFYGDCFGLHHGTLHLSKTTKFGNVIKMNDRVGILLDLKAMNMSVFINGNKVGVAFEKLPSQDYCPAFSIQGMMQITVQKPTVNHSQLISATSTS